MVKNSDNEILRDVIEIFLVNHFNSIELAGSVKQEKRPNVNYYSIDLNDFNGERDAEALNAELSKYLRAWVAKNHDVFTNYLDVAEITVEYLLPEANGSIGNLSRSIVLFFLPSFYYRANSKNDDYRLVRRPITILLLKVWNNYLLRNLIIVSMVFAIITWTNFHFLTHDVKYAERLEKAFEYVNVASSIIASFVLGFIINKVIGIRQEKLKRVGEIKRLSNQLTYFRKVCFNFMRDHQFWNKSNPYISSFNYANSIKHRITSEDFFYPNYEDPILYAKYKSLTNDQESYPIINLVLQLYMFADDEYFDSGLTYTEYPRDYIYKFAEMEVFIGLTDANHIWYCCDEGDYFPDIFPDGYYSKEILKDIKRIDNRYKTKTFTKKLLSKLSLDFQYDIIPTLYHLTKLNEARLPLNIRYFQATFTMILLFGIIIPSVLHIFSGNANYTLLSTLTLISVIMHILLSLPNLLNEENILNVVDDYR